MLGTIRYKLLAAALLCVVNTTAFAYGEGESTKTGATTSDIEATQTGAITSDFETTQSDAIRAGKITAENFGTAPVLNDGKKWRIVFYEGGPHSNYYHYLEANDARSDYLEFVEDGYYSANWDDQLRKENRARILESLKRGNEVDLVIAMGTWAGLDLANNEHAVPTVVMSTSDPVESGIIKSAEDSGYDHVHARVDPYRYERQLRIFHDIIKYKKLGIAFEDSIYGRSYSAIDTVEKVAADIGFEVVKCYTKSDISDTDIASQSVIQCFEELSKKVDAIYVTQQGGVNPDSIPVLVEIANRNRIPTFSQLGSKEVQQGVLFSISRPGFKPAGLFLSATIAQILNGAKPRQLKQLFEETPSIAINLKTAEIVGLYLYADILAAADTIYREIKSP